MNHQNDPIIPNDPNYPNRVDNPNVTNPNDPNAPSKYTNERVPRLTAAGANTQAWIDLIKLAGDNAPTAPANLDALTAAFGPAPVYETVDARGNVVERPGTVASGHNPDGTATRNADGTPTGYSRP